jgi:hypothetical protein
VRSSHRERFSGSSRPLGRCLQPPPATSAFVPESGYATCRLIASLPRGRRSQSGRLDRLTSPARLTFPPVDRSNVVVARWFCLSVRHSARLVASRLNPYADEHNPAGERIPSLHAPEFVGDCPSV